MIFQGVSGIDSAKSSVDVGSTPTHPFQSQPQGYGLLKPPSYLVPTTHKIPEQVEQYGLNHTPFMCGAAGKTTEREL